MAAALLAVLGMGFVSIGSAVTFALASSLPRLVHDRAQTHGRFAGLSADDRSGGAGQSTTGGYPQFGKQVINAC